MNAPAAQASVQLTFGAPAAGVEVTTVNGGGVTRRTYPYPAGLTPAAAKGRAVPLLLAVAEKLGAPHRATAPAITGNVVALRLRTGAAVYSISLTGANGQSVTLAAERPYAAGVTVRSLRILAFAEYRRTVAALLQP